MHQYCFNLSRNKTHRNIFFCHLSINWFVACHLVAACCTVKRQCFPVGPWLGLPPPLPFDSCDSKRQAERFEPICYHLFYVPTVVSCTHCSVLLHHMAIKNWTELERSNTKIRTQFITEKTLLPDFILGPLWKQIFCSRNKHDVRKVVVGILRLVQDLSSSKVTFLYNRNTK